MGPTVYGKLIAEMENIEEMMRRGLNFTNIFARFFRTKFWCQSQNVTRKAAKT